MPLLLAILVTWSVATIVRADDRLPELVAGTSALLVLGPMSSASSFSLDLGARGQITQALWWSGGMRLGFAPLSPEVFGRVSVAPLRETWRPDLGLELGVTQRASLDRGGALLEESREVSRRGLWPVYVAIHATPLRFTFATRYWFSVLELQLGTHLVPFGRYLRAQLGLASLGFSL